MIGFDLVVLLVVSTAAIVIVGFIAKVYDMLRKDLNKGKPVRFGFYFDSKG